MKHTLLLVDLQHDFCLGGTLAVPEGEQVIEIANTLIQQFKSCGLPVIASLDWHPATHKSFAINSNTKVGEIGVLNGLPQVWWPVHCVENTVGAALHSQLNHINIDRCFHKGQNPEVDSYSVFFDNGKCGDTGLHHWLTDNAINQLTIMGLATDYCVKYSVLDALELGYQVNVITDGCRGVNLQPEDSVSALAEMENNGAILTNSRHFLL